MTDAADTAEILDADRAAALPKKSNLSIALAVAGSIALAVGLFLALRGSPSRTGSEAKAEATEGGAVAGDRALGPIVNIEVMVNLIDPDELHYLKCTVAVELTDPRWVPQFESQLVRIRNGVLLYLSNLRLTETMGTANKEKIQTGLRERIVQLAGGSMVKTIYLTDFILQ
jgi:flagellar protein FliL